MASKEELEALLEELERYEKELQEYLSDIHATMEKMGIEVNQKKENPHTSLEGD